VKRAARGGIWPLDLYEFHQRRTPRGQAMRSGTKQQVLGRGSDPAVTDLVRGDQVGSSSLPSCGPAIPCATRAVPSLREGSGVKHSGDAAFGARRLFRARIPVNPSHGQSASPTTRRARTRWWKIDPEMPIDEAALFGARCAPAWWVVKRGRCAPDSSSPWRDWRGGLASILGPSARERLRYRGGHFRRHAEDRRRSEALSMLFNAADPDIVRSEGRTKGGGRLSGGDGRVRHEPRDSSYRIHARGRNEITGAANRKRRGNALTPLVRRAHPSEGRYIGTCVPSRDLPRKSSLPTRGRCRW